MKRIIVVCIFLCFCLALFPKSSKQMLKEWEALSEDEKWLCLLTEPFLGAKEMSLTTVNPEPRNGGLRSRDFLENGWKLHSKEDILDLIERYENGNWGGKDWQLEYAIDSFEKYPGVSIDKIATTECMEIYQAVVIGFYAENRDKLGSHLTLALDLVRILSVLRWGVAAGWLNTAEALSVAKPLMMQLLNAYDSWEDFAVHFAVGWYFYACACGYDFSSYKTDILNFVSVYSSSDIPDNHVVSHNIKFPAKNRNENPILTYDDAEYTPSEEAEKWYLLRRAFSSDPKTWAYADKKRYSEVLAEKKNIPAVALLDTFGIDYYNKNASNMLKKLKDWNSLSEYERWFCLLSEPLMEQNRLGITTLNPEKYINSDKKKVSKSILQKSWDLYSRDDVLKLVEDYRLKKQGYSVTYNAMKEKLNKKPKLSIEEIATKECAENYEIARMYFVSETQNTLGRHNLLAWDYGTVLSILRWSIAAGWIPEKEALTLAEPFIDELINAYDSWEDYASHYAFGCIFSAVSGGINFDVKLAEVLRYIKKYDVQIPEDKKGIIFSYYNIKFPGKNRKDSRVLKYNDTAYSPSKKAASWFMIVKAEKNIKQTKLTEDTALNSFVKQNIKIPSVAYFNAILQINAEWKKYTELINSYDWGSFSEEESQKTFELTSKFHDEFDIKKVKFFDEANPAFKAVKEKSDLYFIFYTDYAFAAFVANDKKKMEFAVSNLDDKKFNTADCYYMYCIYLTQKAKDAAYAKQYADAAEIANLALYYLEEADSLPYLGIISRDIMYNYGGYEYDLKNLLIKCQYNLQESNQP